VAEKPVEPAPVVTPVVEEKPVVVAEAPKAVEPVVAAPVYARRAATAEMVVKANDASDEFALYIVHTGNVAGRVEEGEGIGYAKLATLVKAGKAMTDKNLVLDSGNVVSGTPMVELKEGEVAGVLLDLVGYDAVAPAAEDFAYGADRLRDAAAMAEAYGNVRVLSANVLNARGEWVFQPYQLTTTGLWWR